MKYLLNIHAYDLLDRIAYAAHIENYHDREDETLHETVLSFVGVQPGTGEPDPREWLRDVLVGMLERL